MRYTEEVMDSLRQAGDPELDRIMAALVEGRGLAAINQVLRAAVSNETTVQAALPDDLRAWMMRTARVPAHADRARMGRACEFFVDHGVSMAAILGLASLPECYAASKGVKALHATDQMGYSGTEKRVSETSQFLFQVMAPGSFDDGGAAIAILMKVRMMHSASRLLIQAKDWDSAKDGIPVNQEDLIGTLATFGCTPLNHIQKLGVKVTPEQADDFWYFWSVAGEVLGIDMAFMPGDAAEATLFFDRIKERHWEKSNEGIELTRALIDFYSAMLPGGMLFEGLLPGVVRFLAGDDVADVLEIPKSRWSGLLEGNRLVFRAFNAIQERSSVLNNIVNKLGTKLLTNEVGRIGGGRTAEFLIPTELRRAWRLPPYGSAQRAAKMIRETGETFRSKNSRSDSAVADAVFDIAVLVAYADGEIDDFEEAALADTMAILWPDASTDSLTQKRFKSSVKATVQMGVSSRTAALAKALVELGMLEEGLTLAIAMAYANSGIALEERSVIEAMATAASVSQETLERLVRATLERIESAVV